VGIGNPFDHGNGRIMMCNIDACRSAEEEIMVKATQPSLTQFFTQASTYETSNHSTETNLLNLFSGRNGGHEGPSMDQTSHPRAAPSHRDRSVGSNLSHEPGEYPSRHRWPPRHRW
jgi:hypothetical protein